MLEHPPAGYPGPGCLPPQGIGSPHEWDLPTRALPPTSTMRSPRRCLTANVSKGEERTNIKQKKPQRA